MDCLSVGARPHSRQRRCPKCVGRLAMVHRASSGSASAASGPGFTRSLLVPSGCARTRSGMSSGHDRAHAGSGIPGPCDHPPATRTFLEEPPRCASHELVTHGGVLCY